MFHESEGLFFERMPNGKVLITKTSDGKEPRNDNIKFQQSIEPGAWCSAVCSVSADGEENGRWYEAMKFHGVEA